jgi:serine/threonine protein phosphatase 1
MTYVISDLHGCHTEFIELLDQIQFSPSNDALYILGDVIDRGDKNIDCLQFARKTPNVFLLMGNHEVIPKKTR